MACIFGIFILLEIGSSNSYETLNETSPSQTIAKLALPKKSVILNRGERSFSVANLHAFRCQFKQHGRHTCGSVAMLCDELTGDIPGKVQLRIKGFRKRWTPAFCFYYLTLKGGGANCAFP